MKLSVKDILETGIFTSKEIQASIDLSQASVARQLRQLGSNIIRLKKNRPPKYALTRNAFGVDDKIPLTAVDAYGNTYQIATVRPLIGGAFFIEQMTGFPGVLLGNNGDGFYEDLPYFLDDLRPQGFIGAQIAKEISSRSSDFPMDLKSWNADHIGRYLIINGDDLPGNLKIGQQIWLRTRKQIDKASRDDYHMLAKNALDGETPGSSAGGEQPKFAIYCEDCSAHVIVKFSPKDNNETAKRWKDILITEYWASKVLSGSSGNISLPVIETVLIEDEGRLFLESKRFDRVGEHGRLPMISLAAVDAEFVGLGSDWSQVMMALGKKQLVKFEHVLDTGYLSLFGKFINNTDMHLGNLSLGIEGDIFKLLPAYDMCSMGFAPKFGGELAPFAFTIPKKIELPGMMLFEDYDSVKGMARDFWDKVANDERISDEFKNFLDSGNPMNRLV